MNYFSCILKNVIKLLKNSILNMRREDDSKVSPEAI